MRVPSYLRIPHCSISFVTINELSKLRLVHSNTFGYYSPFKTSEKLASFVLKIFVVFPTLIACATIDTALWALKTASILLIFREGPKKHFLDLIGILALPILGFAICLKGKSPAILSQNIIRNVLIREEQLWTNNHIILPNDSSLIKQSVNNGFEFNWKKTKATDPKLYVNNFYFLCNILKAGLNPGIDLDEDNNWPLAASIISLNFPLAELLIRNGATFNEVDFDQLIQYLENVFENDHWEVMKEIRQDNNTNMFFNVLLLRANFSRTPFCGLFFYVRRHLDGEVKQKYAAEFTEAKNKVIEARETFIKAKKDYLAETRKKISKTFKKECKVFTPQFSELLIKFVGNPRKLCAQLASLRKAPIALNEH